MIKKFIGILLVAVMSTTPIFAASVSNQPYNIGNKKVSLPSIVDGGKTYTELRSISTYAGLSINYKDGIIIIKEPYALRNSNIILEINPKTGQSIKYRDDLSLSEPPALKESNWREILYVEELKTEIRTSDGKTYLPLRFIAEQIGYKLTYVNGTVVLGDSDFKHITTVAERDFMEWGMSTFVNSGFYLTKDLYTKEKYMLKHPKQDTDLSHNLCWYGSGLFGYGTDVDPNFKGQLEIFKMKKTELINKKNKLEKENGKLSPMAGKFYNSLLNAITGLINQTTLIIEEDYYAALTVVHNAINSYNNAVYIHQNVICEYYNGEIDLSAVKKDAKDVVF